MATIICTSPPSIIAPCLSPEVEEYIVGIAEKVFKRGAGDAQVDDAFLANIARGKVRYDRKSLKAEQVQEIFKNAFAGREVMTVGCFEIATGVREQKVFYVFRRQVDAHLN